MTRNHIIFSLLFWILILSLSGCGQSGSDIAKIVEERDSLRVAADYSSRRLALYDALVGSMNSSLDSIISQENGLFYDGLKESGDWKQEMLDNIDRIEEIIQRQKNEIAELEQRLTEGGNSPDDPTLTGLIENYKRQIAQKDAQIAILKEELSRKDADIATLQAKSAAQLQTIAELDNRSKVQQEALKKQDAMLNQCYMVVGSKKDLEKKGIIKKGRIIAQNALDRSKFSKVDIRRFVELTFSAKRPRILTEMPESSYELTTDGEGNYTLVIVNPTTFWSVSNYLVIQTD